MSALQHPATLLATALAIYAVATLRWRVPLPLTLLAVAVVASAMAGFGVPFRHLVEGGFGYLNFILALFAGAFFGQVMVESGAAEAVAGAIERWAANRRGLVIVVAAALLFVVGMFAGLAGVAVLATGVFAAPLLRRMGMRADRSAAFIAVLGAVGMVAPPVNVPAMVMADGVNMPFLSFERALLVLSVPSALFAAWWFGRGLERSGAPAAAVDWPAARSGFLSIGLVVGFWTLLRIFPTVIPDPSAPLVLVAGTVVCLSRLDRARFRRVIDGAFSGTPLFLAAVLVSVGVAVQIMTLTGIRGWLVINIMSFVPPWLFAGLAGIPILGGVLTAIGAANVLGVPFAFALIHQDMILNVAALSAIAALAEFCPPTAIGAALSAYVVRGTGVWKIVKAAAAPLAVLTALAVLMLVLARPLAPLLTH